FDLDLLVHAPISDLGVWRNIVSGQVRELRATGSFELAVAKACDAKHHVLVVAAPNDRRGLVRMILGSRTGRLIGAAPATCWVPRGDRAHLLRIVLGVSGGPQSEQYARLAARLAVDYHPKLELVYIVSQQPLFFTSFGECSDVW